MLLSILLAALPLEGGGLTAASFPRREAAITMDMSERGTTHLTDFVSMQYTRELVVFALSLS